MPNLVTLASIVYFPISTLAPTPPGPPTLLKPPTLLIPPLTASFTKLPIDSYVSRQDPSKGMAHSCQWGNAREAVSWRLCETRCKQFWSLFYGPDRSYRISFNNNNFKVIDIVTRVQPNFQSVNDIK